MTSAAGPSRDPSRSSSIRTSSASRDNQGEWIAPFEEAWRAPRGIEALTKLLRYFALVTDPLPFEMFRAKIRELLPGSGEITMTWAEQMLSEGRAQERVQILRRQLTLKFGAIDAEHEARIAAATPESLDRYLDRILTVTTLDAVFAE
jgi:hypothetical protein